MEPEDLPGTPEFRAFLGRIKERMGDEAGRLVFADWLEESGFAESARYMRWQAGLPRLKIGRTVSPFAGGPQNAPAEWRRVTIGHDLVNLDRFTARTWADEELSLCNPVYPEYYGGFVTRALCSVADWAEWGDRVLSATPFMREVRFHGEMVVTTAPAADGMAVRIDGLDHGAVVPRDRSLNPNDYPPPPGPDLLSWLANLVLSSRWPGVKRWRLPDVQAYTGMGSQLFTVSAPNHAADRTAFVRPAASS